MPPAWTTVRKILSDATLRLTLQALMDGNLTIAASRGTSTVRYRWVLVRLVLTVGLCVLVLVALRGGVPEAALAGRAMGSRTGYGSTSPD